MTQATTISSTSSVVDETMNSYPNALTVGQLAERVEGAVEGDHGVLILGVSGIEDAEEGHIVYAENARFLSQAAQSRASAIVAFLDATIPDKPLIKVSDPRYAFTRILELFKTPLNVSPGVHPSAVLGRNVEIGEEVSIGPHVTVGDNARIGARSVIMAGCYVGDDCEIAEDCLLYPNVTLYHGTRLGRNVIVNSGTVIGADGFGYMRVGDHSYKIPQIGIVEIGDEVEIGANCTIDRSKTGSTVIGARTKIDNLVHIAHNVKTGPDCIIVAQAGVAGSCKLGRGVTLAGQAGLKDGLTIGDGATVLAQAGVIRNVEPGQSVSGYPARPHMEKQRQYAHVEKLGEYVERIRELEKSNARLEQLVRALAEKAGIGVESRESRVESPSASAVRKPQRGASDAAPMTQDRKPGVDSKSEGRSAGGETPPLHTPHASRPTPDTRDP